VQGQMIMSRWHCMQMSSRKCIIFVIEMLHFSCWFVL